MSTVYEIIFHKELNMIHCFCGFMGMSHHCTQKVKGTIKIFKCLDDCKVCEKEVDRKKIQRPHSEHNFGVPYYEEVSSPFLLFKFYLDVLCRIFFNLHDKHLLPFILKEQYLSTRQNYSAGKKIKEDTYIFTVKLIKRLVVSTCQVVNPHMFIHVF